MTPEAMRMRIAESQGIEVLLPRGIMGRKKGWGDGDWKMLPDYTNDLNACHEMILTLHEDRRYMFALELAKLVTPKQNNDYIRTLDWSLVFRFMSGTPDQYCEAFLRTIGKWEDAQ